jgi:hypothetical protein
MKAKGKRKKAKLRSFLFLSFSFFLFTLHLFTFAASAQRVAVLAPDGEEASRRFAADIENALLERVSVRDSSLAQAAFNAAAFERPYNLTTDQSKSVGAAMGCEYFILVRGATLRRSASRRPEYYEAYAAVFVVSSRSGRLVEWTLQRFEASKPATAEKMLAASIAPLARRLAAGLKNITRSELAEAPPPEMEEIPATGAPAAKNFRAPIPYRRIKPAYTNDAYLFDVTATLDMIIDLDAAGNISRTEVVRWAGYGLDESVERTVRAMNWRPAERNGKPLAMRFLVRYNFKKAEKATEGN